MRPDKSTVFTNDVRARGHAEKRVRTVGSGDRVRLVEIVDAVSIEVDVNRHIGTTIFAGVSQTIRIGVIEYNAVNFIITENVGKVGRRRSK